MFAYFILIIVHVAAMAWLILNECEKINSKLDRLLSEKDNNQ